MSKNAKACHIHGLHASIQYDGNIETYNITVICYSPAYNMTVVLRHTISSSYCMIKYDGHILCWSIKYDHHTVSYNVIIILYACM